MKKLSLPALTILFIFLLWGNSKIVSTSDHRIFFEQDAKELLVLIAGFMMLTISEFQPTKEMGILTASTIAIALLADLLLLPALLILFDRDSNESGPPQQSS